MKSPAFQFYPKDWETPNSYLSYTPLPLKAGIYAFVNASFNKELFEWSFSVLYIGMSKNIASRVRNHDILPILNERYGGVQVYFQEHAVGLRKIERDLIKAFCPIYNLQHRERGAI